LLLFIACWQLCGRSSQLFGGRIDDRVAGERFGLWCSGGSGGESEQWRGPLRWRAGHCPLCSNRRRRWCWYRLPLTA